MKCAYPLILALFLTGCSGGGWRNTGTPVQPPINLSTSAQTVQRVEHTVQADATALRDSLESAPKDEPHFRADATLERMQQQVAELALVVRGMQDGQKQWEQERAEWMAKAKDYEKQIADLQEAAQEARQAVEKQWNDRMMQFMSACAAGAIVAAIAGFWWSGAFIIAVALGLFATIFTLGLGVGMLGVSLAGGAVLLLGVVGVYLHWWKGKRDQAGEQVKQAVQDEKMRRFAHLHADAMAGKGETLREVVVYGRAEFPAFDLGFSERYQQHKAAKSAGV